MLGNKDSLLLSQKCMLIGFSTFLNMNLESMDQPFESHKKNVKHKETLLIRNHI